MTADTFELCRRLVRSAVCGPFDEAIAPVAELSQLGAWASPCDVLLCRVYAAL